MKCVFFYICSCLLKSWMNVFNFCIFFAMNMSWLSFFSIFLSEMFWKCWISFKITFFHERSLLFSFFNVDVCVSKLMMLIMFISSLRKHLNLASLSLCDKLTLLAIVFKSALLLFMQFIIIYSFIHLLNSYSLVCNAFFKNSFCVRCDCFYEEIDINKLALALFMLINMINLQHFFWVLKCWRSHDYTINYKKTIRCYKDSKIKFLRRNAVVKTHFINYEWCISARLARKIRLKEINEWIEIMTWQKMKILSAFAFIS